MKRIDIYWVKVFDIRNAGEERKYTLLSKVVRNCLSLQNANTNVERCLSDNEVIVKVEVIEVKV